jgi:hypothetical protein
LIAFDDLEQLLLFAFFSSTHKSHFLEIFPFGMNIVGRAADEDADSLPGSGHGILEFRSAGYKKNRILFPA